MSLEVTEGKLLPIAYISPPHIGQKEQSYGDDRFFLEALGNPPRSAFCTPHHIDSGALRYFFESSYISRLEKACTPGEARSDIMFDPVYIEWSRRALGASTRAAEIGVQYGLGFSRVGGFHHATFEQGSDFCVYSDILFLIQRALQKNPDQHVVVWDTDAHVADGLCKTIDKFKGRATVYDLHNEAYSKFVPVDASQHYLPIPVSSSVSDQGYLEAVTRMAHRIQSDARAKPVDLIIFVSGYDILGGDKGGFDLSPQTALTRDMLVYETALTIESPHRGTKAPVIWLPAGGYTPESDTAFGRSVVWGVERLRKARRDGELSGFK